jgi:hypothetical protein
MLTQRLVSRLRSIDWDFSGSFSESEFSSIHWQPGRFVSQIPATLIGLLSEPSDLVLDPFAGSGTTLIEAQRLGRRSIGIELNPISCVAIRAKTINVSVERLRQDILALKEQAANAIACSFTDRLRIQGLVPITVQGDKRNTNS